MIWIAVDRNIRAFILTAMLALGAAPSFAIGTIIDGAVTFGYTNDFITSAGNTVDTEFIGAATGDLTWESWWFFRVSGDGQEFAFAAPDTESYVGSIARLDWADAGGSAPFRAALSAEVIDTGAGMGNLFQNLSIFNTGPSALTIDIFHYTDLDVGNSFGADNAILISNPSAIEVSVIDGADSAPIIAYGADHYQVTPWRTVLNELTDTNVDDLDDSGLPFGPGDYTGAFQWTRTLAAGGSEAFVTQFGSNAPLLPRSASAIPEPGTALLVGIGCMLLARCPRRD
jgi:hypothetical protein